MAEEALVTASRLSDLDSGLVETCSDYLVSHSAALKEAVRAGQRGLDVAARYAQMFDGLLGSLTCAARAAQLRYQGLGRVSLVAVGGYGRRLVAPNSDVDVVFLADNPGDERVARLAEGVLYPLWDAGVQIGHAVRGVEETLDLGKNDIRTSTTLLDLRHVAGDRSLIVELTERARTEIFEADLDAFISALETDTDSRHERYGGTLFLREPELKLGRGGLRDLDVVNWIARARWGIERMEDLVSLGFLSQDEWLDLATAQEHFWMVRNRLHVINRRRHDRLTFEDQESVAALLGYRDGIRLGVEQFMQTHYRRARTIARLIDRMPERARRSGRKPPVTIREVGRNVFVHDGQITLRRDQLDTDMGLPLRFYSAVMNEGFPPEPESRDAIGLQTAKPEYCQALRRDREAITRFCELLTYASTPALRRGSVLEELHEVGLLVALIPELESIMGRVPHDAYHAYTADVHALLTVDRLRAVARGEFAAEFPVVSRCAAELPRPLPLYVAALLFELGAGHPDSPAKYAAAIAGPICERLGLGAADTKHVQWLIASQQSLYNWALRRDISDPDILTEIAREVQTVDRLRDLYLLTFCSAATANPTAMTAWNARMLMELWLNVSDLIEGRRASSDYVESLREQVLTDVPDRAEREAVEKFLVEMPERYLLANGSADVQAHERIARERNTGGTGPLVSIRKADDEGSLEIVIVTDDRPGLLADLAAALSLHRYDVVSAQLYTRTRPGERHEAFDIFHVTRRDLALGYDDDTAAEAALVCKTIAEMVSGHTPAQALVGRRAKNPAWSRNGPKIKTEIGVDNNASKIYTVVDVYTRDRPELLYAIANTLHEHDLSIALAKVNTEGRRVADVFYVQTSAGGKLAKSQLALLSDSLRETIHKLDA